MDLPMTGLTDWMREQIDKHNVPNTQMAWWFEEGDKHKKRRIVDLKRKVWINNPKVILNHPDTSDSLKQLQTQYVIVTFDKANKNVIFVCKTFHMKTLLEKLGLQTGFSKT